MTANPAFIIAWTLLVFSSMGLADIAVIANHALDIDSVSKTDASNLYLGKVKTLKNNIKPVLFDLPEKNKLKPKFYQSLTRKNLSQLHSYRARKLFTGQGYFLPTILNDSHEILITVSSTKNAIGYIPANEVNPSVKVLFTLKEE